MARRASTRPGGTRSAVTVDTALAAVLFGLFAASTHWNPTDPAAGLRWLGWEGYLTGAFVCLPLALRRVAPEACLLVVTAGIVDYRLLDGSLHPVMTVAVFVAIFSVGAHGRPVARDVVRALAVAALLGVVVALTLLADSPLWPSSLRYLHVVAVASDGLVYGAAWVLGEQWRQRRAREGELAARTAELEDERARNSERAATEERLRIARELHDVVGHHVSVMGVQAAGARRVLPTDPPRAATVLVGIEQTARQAVAELQRVLALLRHADDRPRPELARLNELATEIREAGVAVTVQTDDLPALPASVDLAATRVVQEALTNVLRHAGPGSSAWVQVRLAGDELRVEVTDDGAGRPPATAAATALPGGGSGLAGLRERVELHGGRFTAGPHASGGYQVTAHLPTTSSRTPVGARA